MLTDADFTLADPDFLLAEVDDNKVILSGQVPNGCSCYHETMWYKSATQGCCHEKQWLVSKKLTWGNLSNQ